MPTERKRAIRTTTAWNADQAAMEALYGVGNYYTSLSAWEAGEQANLTTLDEIRTGVCYNDWPSGLDNNVTISGSTTDATRFMRITVAAGHRHDGTAAHSGFWLKRAHNASAIVLIFGQPGTQIDGLDIEQTSTGEDYRCIRNLDSASVQISNCVVKSVSGAAGGGIQSNGNATIRSCYAYQCARGGFNITDSDRVYNSVSANNLFGFIGAGAPQVKNCVAYSCTYSYFSLTGTNSNNNAASNTETLGSAPITGVTSAAFANAASNDFHLSSGSVLRGAGVNLYSDFQTDIDGDTWPSSGAWDIGFDYYVAGGGLTINSITASNITQTGATITLGLTR